MTRLVSMCLIVAMVFGGFVSSSQSKTLPPDVILPWLKFDRRTNSITASWLFPPDSSEIKGYRIYANFLGSMPAGEVDAVTSSFTHKLSLSLIGIKVTYTIKSFSDVESKGVSITFTPSMASVELTGFGTDMPIAANSTTKIGIKRNRYTLGKLLFDIDVYQQSFQTRFSTIVEESQNEVFFTAPVLNGKAVARVWLGPDRTCLIGEFESQILTSQSPSFISLVEPKTGQQIVKGNNVRIAWKQGNLPKGGSIKIELWDPQTGNVISEMTPDSDATSYDWKLQSLYRPERVIVMVYYKHLINYYATRLDNPAIVLLSKPKILVPPKPEVSLTPDQKRNCLDMNISCENSGSAEIKWIEVTATGSDSTVRNYKLAPDDLKDFGGFSMRYPLYHVRIGVKYFVTAKAVTDDGDSLVSEEASYEIPKDWTQVYIESLKPGDSIAVGSRLKLLWSTHNIWDYLGADQMSIFTPTKEYSLDYFKTSAQSTMLEVLLEGLAESDNARLWIKVVTIPDDKGFSQSYFEYIDNLRLVAPPKFVVETIIGTDRVNFSWDPVDKAKYYNIRKRGYGEKFMKIKSIRDVTSFEDDELTADSDYDYQIEARNSTDEVIARADISVHSKLNIIKPTITKSKYFISLAWDRVRWVEGYNIYRYDVSNWTPVNNDTLSLSEYIDSGLTPGKEYCYRIEAVTSTGRFVGMSEKTCISTDIGKIEAKVLPDTQSVSLNWDTDSEIISYRVWRKDIGQYLKIADEVKGRGYEDKNLDSYKVFTYKVEGLDRDGNVIAVSDELGTRTLQIENMNLEAIPNPPQKQIKLKWTKVDKTSRLELWRDGKLLKIIPADSTQYLDFGLANSSRYCFVIKAYNTNNNLIATGDLCVDMPKLKSKVVFTVGSKSWWIDGVEQEKMAAAPEIKDGRLYLIVRYLAQSVGARVAWEASTKTVSIVRKDSYWLTLAVGNPRANVNGTMTEIEPGNPKTAPYIRNGVTFCPFRFLCNQLGATDENIVWDAKTKTVTIEF